MQCATLFYLFTCMTHWYNLLICFFRKFISLNREGFLSLLAAIHDMNFIEFNFCVTWICSNKMTWFWLLLFCKLPAKVLSWSRSCPWLPWWCLLTRSHKQLYHLTLPRQIHTVNIDSCLLNTQFQLTPVCKLYWIFYLVRHALTLHAPNNHNHYSVHEKTQATQKWPALSDRWPALLTST